MITRHFLIVVFALFGSSLSMAQERELEPVEDAAAAIGSILGGKENGIAKVRIISDTEQSLSIQVETDGFDDHEYTIHGAVLNRIKKPLKEVETEDQTLPKGGGVVELGFRFDQESKSYSGSHLESHFIALTISKKDALLSKLDLGGENVFGDTYLYKLNKKWRVSGNEAMVIEVKLTPFRSAGTIQP
jgi:hypothetical protein